MIALDVNLETYLKYKDYFDDCRVKSQGWSSVVMNYDETHVIKFSHNPNDGFRLYNELNNVERHQFGLPEMKLQDVIDDDVVFIIEKLQRIPYTFWTLIPNYNWEETNSLTRQWLWDYSKAKNKQLEKVKLLKIVLKNYDDSSRGVQHPLRNMLIKACCLVIHFADRNKMVGLDINPSNIMAREDGTLIWSDVLGSYNPYNNIYGI